MKKETNVHSRKKDNDHEYTKFSSKFYLLRKKTEKLKLNSQQTFREEISE